MIIIVIIIVVQGICSVAPKMRVGLQCHLSKKMQRILTSIIIDSFDYKMRVTVNDTFC